MDDSSYWDHHVDKNKPDRYSDTNDHDTEWQTKEPHQARKSERLASEPRNVTSEPGKSKNVKTSGDAPLSSHE